MFNNNKSDTPSNMDAGRANLLHVQSFMSNNAQRRSRQIRPGRKSGQLTFKIDARDTLWEPGVEAYV